MFSNTDVIFIDCANLNEIDFSNCNDDDFSSVPFTSFKWAQGLPFDGKIYCKAECHDTIDSMKTLLDIKRWEIVHK